MRGFDWRSSRTGESERTAGKRCATPVAGGSQGAGYQAPSSPGRLMLNSTRAIPQETRSGARQADCR